MPGRLLFTSSLAKIKPTAATYINRRVCGAKLAAFLPCMVTEHHRVKTLIYTIKE
jgi:hypothetical protein